MDIKENSPSSDEKIGKAVIWGVISLALAIVFCVFNESYMVLRASFMMKLLAVLAGTVLGLCGALLGDVIRQFAKPDFVMTRGGMSSLIWIRLFWSIGPQVIGLVFGISLGISLVLR